MAVTVSMPQLGETVTEGTILSWAKKPGDSISEDEVLLEISTDKVDTEIPSPAAASSGKFSCRKVTPCLWVRRWR